MARFVNDANLKEIIAVDNMDFTGAAAPASNFVANGQLAIGSGTFPNIIVGTLTAGPGVTITNGAGSITIAASGALVTTWQEIATATAAVAGNGYISTAALTLTLPAGAAMGTNIGTMVLSTGALTVKAQGTDTIRMANQVSAAAGSAVSQTNGTISGASAQFIYDATSGVWFAYAGYSGTWNVA
jgi:hypothetical protein